MVNNIEQHEGFQAGLDDPKGYATDCLDASNPDVAFTSPRDTELIECFAAEFRHHFWLELPTSIRYLVQYVFREKISKRLAVPAVGYVWQT